MPDNGWQVWDLRVVWYGKPRAEVVPEGDAELGAGLVEAEKGIAAIATGIAPGAAAHLSFGDLATARGGGRTCTACFRPLPSASTDTGPLSAFAGPSLTTLARAIYAQSLGTEGDCLI